ncbi:hypothetical protein [Mesorhizobium sp.]|uniref:hypothetical protein n=1 Tax=Mesorhizobium sp. TaxID=1871066 RepID=UPI0025F878EA|nr:hypothetical protein [Mesorhizobium sp.]
MALELVPCPACGRFLSPEADSCPGCAHPMPENNTDKVRATSDLHGGLQVVKGPPFVRVSLFWRGLGFLCAAPALYLIPYAGIPLALLSALAAAVFLLGKHYVAECPSCGNSVEIIAGTKKQKCNGCGHGLEFQSPVAPGDLGERMPTPPVSVPVALPCPTCGNKVWTKSDVCPHCAQPLRKGWIEQSQRSEDWLEIRGVLVKTSIFLILMLIVVTWYLSIDKEAMKRDLDEAGIRRKVGEIVDGVKEDWCKDNPWDKEC